MQIIVQCLCRLCLSILPAINQHVFGLWVADKYVDRTVLD